jgi:hypothetical protein
MLLPIPALPRICRVLWPAALLPAVAAYGAQLPEPLLELTFDRGLVASGEISPPIQPMDYAEGEGPVLLPGPWGDCLDLTAASRFGGTLEQMEPAGGALLLSDPALDDLGAFTVTLWAQPAGAADAVNARLLNKMGSWELSFSRGSFALLVVNGDTKRSYGVPRAPRVDEWQFVAVTVDPGAASIGCRMGDPQAGLGEALIHELAQPPDRSDGELQIGTFNGIRPFRGQLDNLRISDRALTDEEVTAAFEQDRAAYGGTSIYASGMPPMPTGRFAFKPSDIVFSSRWQSRRKEEALQLLQAYHVTHLLWVYGNDPEYIRDVHDLGVLYQGTLNGLCGCDKATPDPSGADDTTGRQQDFDGNKVVLPHMRKWSPDHPRWTGNHNSPAFRELFFEEADKLVVAGIDSLHVDDWEMALSTATNGLSGFSPESLEGFRSYVQGRLTEDERQELGIEDAADFDYRTYLQERHGVRNQEEYRAAYRDLPTTPYFLDFQARGLRDFYQALREHLDRVSPDKYIPISVNNQFYRRTAEGGLRGVFCVDRLDFFEGEASQGMQAPQQFIMPCKAAEAMGIPQVMMSKPHLLGHSFAALATSYALGMPFRVPWDLYMDNDPDGQPAPRYYGELEKWGPFYDFVHEHADLFHDYVAAATVGVLFNADEPCHSALVTVCADLAEAQIPFALIGAASRYGRVPLRQDRLEAARYVVVLSPIESFCDEDRQTIEAARDSRRVRFLQPTDGLVKLLVAAGRAPIRVEGPEGVFAFLRVRGEPEPGAVIHLVNWNAAQGDAEDPAGPGAEVFGHVTLSLQDPESWGSPLQVSYHQPGQAQTIAPETHPGVLRITLPELATWGIVEIRPTGA